MDSLPAVNWELWCWAAGSVIGHKYLGSVILSHHSAELSVVWQPEPSLAKFRHGYVDISKMKLQFLLF